MESEIERLTAENERLNNHLKKLQSLFSGAMFDIRNPMYMVSAGCDLMLDSNDLSSEDKNKIFEVINKNAYRVSDYLGILQVLQHGGIHHLDQIEKHYVKELIEIVQNLPDKIPKNSQCKIDLMHSSDFSNNDFVQLPSFSFGNGVRLIVEELIEIGSTNRIYVNFFKQKNLLRIELSTEIGKLSEETIHNRLDGLRFIVVDLIFELYGGVLHTEKQDNQVVSILELPLVEMEEVDGGRG